MKKNIRTIIYIFSILLAFMLMYRANQNLHRNFIWKQTYSTQDKQPFGSYAFDKLLKSSLKDEYTHTYNNISYLNENDILHGKNLLIISGNFQPSNYEIDILFDFLKEGGTAFIAASNYSLCLYEKLYISIENRYFPEFFIYSGIDQQHKTINFCTPELKKEQFKIPAKICSGFFKIDSVDKIKDITQIVAKTTDNEIIMLRYNIGKGNLILTCNPLIYTNYGILNDQWNMFIWNSLAYLHDKPLVRTEYYHLGSNALESNSPLRYLLSVKHLRWGLIIAISTIFLFMIFTAKRRQRTIPVVKPHKNRMLDFVHSVAGLYIQKNNNADIILKKKIYWSDNLKKKYGIDIINENQDNEFFNRFSSKTGKTVEELSQLLKFLKK